MPRDGANFHQLMHLSREDPQARKLVIDTTHGLYARCQPIAWDFPSNKHVWLQGLYAAGGQSLTRQGLKEGKSVQQAYSLPMKSSSLPKAEKQRWRTDPRELEKVKSRA